MKNWPQGLKLSKIFQPIIFLGHKLFKNTSQKNLKIILKSLLEKRQIKSACDVTDKKVWNFGLEISGRKPTGDIKFCQTLWIFFFKRNTNPWKLLWNTVT